MNNETQNQPLNYFLWKLCDTLIDYVMEHDYSYQFSEDRNVYRNGKDNETLIKSKIKELVMTYNIKPEGLLSDCLNNRSEQYDNGLTHTTIKQWFSPYLNK